MEFPDLDTSPGCKQIRADSEAPSRAVPPSPTLCSSAFGFCNSQPELQEAADRSSVTARSTPPRCLSQCGLQSGRAQRRGCSAVRKQTQLCCAGSCARTVGSFSPSTRKCGLQSHNQNGSDPRTARPVLHSELPAGSVLQGRSTPAPPRVCFATDLVQTEGAHSSTWRRGVG